MHESLCAQARYLFSPFVWLFQVGHRQEVCGLKWSPDNQYLASGGNDNKLFVWNLNSLQPVHTYTEHIAAVKAIAWSPHHHGLLASGGGTADRCIRFWNTLTGQPMQSVDTGSQVCNLAWSKHASELVSTWSISCARLDCQTYYVRIPHSLYSGLYTRVLAEPDPRMEIPLARAGGQAHGPLLPRPLSGHVAGRGGDRHGRRRRDPQVLERLLEGEVTEGIYDERTYLRD